MVSTLIVGTFSDLAKTLVSTLPTLLTKIKRQVNSHPLSIPNTLISFIPVSSPSLRMSVSNAEEKDANTFFMFSTIKQMTLVLLCLTSLKTEPSFTSLKLYSSRR